MIRFTFPARLESLDVPKAAIQRLDALYEDHAARPSAKTLYAWGLAVYEACTNVVAHGSDDNGVPSLQLSIEPLKDHVVFWLEDDGQPNNNWSKLREPTPWDEHGHGIQIIRAIMEDAAYGRSKDGKNILLMLARLAPVHV